MPDTAAPAPDSHPVEVHAAGTPLTGLGTLAVGVIAIAALYFGREVLVPMALALLLSFALGPPVMLLRRWHSNRVFAVMVVVVLAFSVILGIAALIGSQLAHLAENLPGYQYNITEKIHSLRDTTTSSGVVGRAAAVLSFIRLAGARDLRRTTLALDDAARRLSRYLLLQTGINASLGVLVGSGLWVIGVPNPVLWGILTMLLRFVPYIGPVIAAAFPAALAFAVDPGGSMLFWVVGLFLVAEGITGQAIEPWLYGQSTGLSDVAVVVAAAFWTLLWGPIGLLLSTPLTMCLVVLGRHVEHLQFLEVLLGDRPALAPEESFYQRMLADDPDEAPHQAEAFLKDKPLSVYYDEVAIRGLALAEHDVNRGALDHARRVRVKEAVEWVIDDLSDHDDASAPTCEEGANEVAALPSVLSQEELAPGWRETAVLCVAGRGSLDEAAAAMLAQLLEKHGIGARVVPSEAVSVANLVWLEVTGVQVVCLSYLEPGNFTNARYLVRRLRRRLPQAKIVAGFWTLAAQEAEERGALAATRADCVVTSLRQAVEQVVNAAKEEAAADLEDEKRAPVAPPASASTDSVVGCPVVFDQTQRTETVDEEANSAAGRARRLAAAA